MSFYSNHCPEVVEEVHDRVAAEEGYPDPAPPTPWPADWSETDALYYEQWSTSVDLSAPMPEPDDLGEPNGSWFTDDPPKAA
jgi:hypothetical protein